MGGVLGTISFDVANHAFPLDSSIRQGCSDRITPQLV
jgi:hypothetical protein